ncbi:Ltp family lipoprotein [Oceanobacillus kimchii]|uniref:Putative host cell surface-exposed lipoprotein Ltp-like HTH region domain-containing protein n=1 Tax=Oceanobacillus kimchii TaxID=746691 RepID=A0ABQ5THR4_9BACI|nr:Ltp family lipoprotein [Oceanobacillus kimchii]GLO65104.1 hypothetical protein MACH08_08880 [Oceanobacillus kimchii]
MKVLLSLKISVSQENAIRQAESYLDFSAFSKSGLIEQLEYERFSKEYATFAVENIKLIGERKRYYMQKVIFTGFSRSGLIDQLLYEGHSEADANYAAEQVGL